MRSKLLPAFFFTGLLFAPCCTQSSSLVPPTALSPPAPAPPPRDLGLKLSNASSEVAPPPPPGADESFWAKVGPVGGALLLGLPTVVGGALDMGGVLALAPPIVIPKPGGRLAGGGMAGREGGGMAGGAIPTGLGREGAPTAGHGCNKM